MNIPLRLLKMATKMSVEVLAPETCDSLLNAGLIEMLVVSWLLTALSRPACDLCQACCRRGLHRPTEHHGVASD